MKHISFLLLMLLNLVSFAQQTPTTSCSIFGKVIDKSTGEEIPFANVILYKNDSIQVNVTNTNLDGGYEFKNINPGIYKVSAVYVGYGKNSVAKINVTKATKIDIQLSSGGIKLDEVVIAEYSMPVTSPDVKTTSTITREEYQNMVTRNMNSTAGTTTGVYGKKSKEKSLVVGGIPASYSDYNTEEYSRIYDNEFKDSKKDPLSTFSIDVDKALIVMFVVS